MGTDLFTSARGPGVIGTLMALVVLVGFGSLYLLVFDKRFQGEGDSIESVIAADATQIDSLKKRRLSATEELEKTKGFRQIERDLRNDTVRHEFLIKEKTELETKVTAAKEEIAALQESVEAYQQAYRESARASMIGREMDQLQTSDGKVYSKVKITAIDPVRAQIRHQGGFTGVPLETLPQDLQDYLQIDENEKEETLAMEGVAREQSSDAFDHGNLRQRIRDLKLTLADVTRKRNEKQRLAERASAAIPQLERALISKREELQRENAKASTGGVSNAPQVRVQIQQLERKLRNATGQGPAIRAEVRGLDQEIRDIESRIAEAEREVRKIEEKARGSGS